MPMENELNRINEVLNIKLKNLTIDAINLQIINEIKEELKGYMMIYLMQYFQFYIRV